MAKPTFDSSGSRRLASSSLLMTSWSSSVRCHWTISLEETDRPVAPGSTSNARIHSNWRFLVEMPVRDRGEGAVLRTVGPSFHLLSADRDESFIRLGSMATELIDFRDVLVDRPSRFLGIEVVSAPRDVVDSRTKIGHVRA